MLPASLARHARRPPTQQRRNRPVNSALIKRRIVRQPQRRFIRIADPIRNARRHRGRQRRRLPILPLRPDPECRNRNPDQLRVTRRELVPTQPQRPLLRNRPRRDHRLARRRQPPEQPPPGGCSQIERHAALVRIQKQMQPAQLALRRIAGERPAPPHRIAARRLHLDHVRAQIRQQLPRIGRRNPAPVLQDAETV